jgi:hypothetical protein
LETGENEIREEISGHRIPMTSAERLKKWRFNSGRTKNPHIKRTPEEKRERERLKKQKHRENQKKKHDIST